MAFPPQFLEELRGRLSLVSVIGRKVKLTRKGREFSGLCPFHNEKSPSFTVNEDKGFYHCFGCGAHGDVLGFEMNANHLTFPEAVERLAAEAGLDLPRQSFEDRAVQAQRLSLYDAMEAAARFYQQHLLKPSGRHGLDYLQGRGLDKAAIDRFRLGFSPDSRDALKTALMSAEITEAMLIEAGLLIKPEGGGASYDRFRGRVMFPITDRKGRVIAFGGRIMGDGQPKYLNSPDTPLFHKGHVLYNLFLAKPAARERNAVVVCEGYMDVIAMTRGGFPHAVAPLGTALTEQQIEELWKLTQEPTLCFDGDAAGQRAAAKAAERALPLLKPGFSLRFATVPAPEDPDSLIRDKGPAAMQDVLAKAEPLYEVLWRGLIANRPLDTPERRAALERDLLDCARQIEDATVQSQYQRMFKDRLWEMFRAARQRSFTPARAPGGRPGGRQGGAWKKGPLPHPGLPEGAGLRQPVSAEVLQQRILLATLVNHPPMVEYVGERLGMVRFSDYELDNLRQEILKQLGGGLGLDSETFQLHLRSCGFSRALDSLLGSNVYVHAAFARPDAPEDVARAGWEHVFKLYLHKELKADIQRAEERLASDMSDRSYGYFRALQVQEQHAGAGEGDGAAEALEPGAGAAATHH